MPKEGARPESLRNTSCPTLWRRFMDPISMARAARIISGSALSAMSWQAFFSTTFSVCTCSSATRPSRRLISATLTMTLTTSLLLTLREPNALSPA